MVEHATYWSRHRETMPLAELRELQNEKLQAIVHEAYNAPVIRDRWQEAGVEPDDIETIEDLTAVPIFRKQQIRGYVAKGDPFGGRLNKPMSVLAEKRTYVGTTSGTTGAPSNILVTGEDRDIAATWAARHLWAAGLRPGDAYVNILPHREIISKTFMEGAHDIGAITSDVYLGPNEVDRIVHLLQSLEPTVIFALASPIVDALESYFEENDRDPEGVFESVETAIWSAEPLVGGYREKLETEFGITVMELAGSIEPRWSIMGCGRDPGWLHLPDDHFYVETVDPETEECNEDGSRGELVVTTLSYEGMSHVRWGTDDIGELKRETCDCGRTGTKVNVQGRVDDLLTVDGAQVLPIDVLQAVDAVDELPGNFFQLYSDSESAGVLRLRIGYDPEATGDVDALRDRVGDAVAAELGVPVEVADAMTESEIRDTGPQAKVPRIVPE